MNFPYYKARSSDPRRPWISVPWIPITLDHSGSDPIPLYALLDSGADRCLFHADIARALGLNIEQGIPDVFSGIEGGKIRAYLHKVRVRLRGSLHSIEVTAGFSESPGIAAILGQQDFFDAYKITFDRSKDRIEIR